MLFVVLFFLALSSIALIFTRRDKQTLLMLGLCFSFICMYVGIIIYLAKTGGMSPGQKMVLFFDTEIQRRLSYLAIPLKKLGYMIAIGRYLFPAFLLLLAMNYSMIPAVIRFKQKFLVALVCPVISLIVYYPALFPQLVKRHTLFQQILMKSMVVWIVVYVLLAIGLLIYEYKSITIPYCKKQFRYIMLFILVLTVLYLFYCIQDPIQVYQMYSAEYMRMIGRLYIKYTSAFMGTWGLTAASTAMIALVVAGFWNLRNYTLLDKEENQGDISMQRKFDTASRGISVFVHSMKNQLLSNRIIHKKINRELENPQPDLTRLREYAKMLEGVNESMLVRMEELYKSVKSDYISLSPVSAEEVVLNGVEKFSRKYPEIPVTVNLECKDYVLADNNHLAEACYNLLTNAHESVLASGKKEEILELNTHHERLYVAFEVRDNGKGICKGNQRKIFDPFYTSKNTNYNWGMGLYYVRQIVKSHLGILKIESVEGEGCSFFLMIPRYNPRKDRNK